MFNFSLPHWLVAGVLAAIYWWWARSERAAKKAIYKPIVQLQPNAVLSRDDQWKALANESLRHASDMQWGLYTNSELAKANFLEDEHRLKDALNQLLWVLYLDINGPENRGGMSKALIREFPPFDPTGWVVAPVVVDRISEIAQELGINKQELSVRFMETASRRMNKLMPLTPNAAWKKANKHIEVD